MDFITISFLGGLHCGDEIQVVAPLDVYYRTNVPDDHSLYLDDPYNKHLKYVKIEENVYQFEPRETVN